MGSAVKVGPLTKQKVSLHAQYHDEDAESAPYRIDKAIEGAESSMCAVLDEKRRTLNDGSVDAELVVDVGAIANSARPSKVVANALNAVARNANGLDGLIADLDSGKYDSVNWMPKVIGPGTLYPDGMKFPTGLGYDDEEKVRAAWKSGKYASVVLYKGGSKRGEIPVNVRNAKVIDDEKMKDAYKKACRSAAQDVANRINSLIATVESAKMDDVTPEFIRYYADIVSAQKSIAAFIGACR